VKRQEDEMPKKRESRANDFTPLPFEIDSQVDEALLTAHAGVPLAIELFRASGAAQVVDEQVRLKERARGLSASQMVESLMALWLAGGDRCEDMNRLREDEALSQLLGYELPSANAAREFLERFDVEDGPLFKQGEQAVVPEESEPLRGLGAAQRALLAAVQKCAPQKRATLDVDATIVESHKKSAAEAYDGTTGFQPVVALWAEQDLIVHDEFRAGNVPAGCGNGRILERALEALPEGVKEIYLRADTALYENEVMTFCEARGIGYAISADMSVQLRQEIERLPEEAWQLDREEADAHRHWAEVAYVPSDGDWRKDRPCVRRYLVVRILKKQGLLFPDGSDRRHFAVVTNREGDGLAILRWHRQKAGTVEHAHDVLKNELAGAALPSAKFGANAAWWRLNTLTFNLLSALKRLALPGEFSDARPKRLRFMVLNVVGKVVRHARRMLLRLTSAAQQALLCLLRTKIRSLQVALSGD
jgi:hypothetical protein